MRRKTLLVAFLIMVSVIILHFWDQSRIFETKRQEQTEKRLTWGTHEDIGSVEIHSTTETIQIARDTKGWRLNKPCLDLADEWQVRVLLDSLLYAEIEEIVAESSHNLANFGLEPPRIAVDLRGRAGQVLSTLLFGDRTPTGTSCYAMLKGDPRVFTLSVENYYVVSRPASEIREKTVFRHDRDNICRLEVAWGNGEGVAVSRDESGLWRLIVPTMATAEQDKINVFLGKITGLRVSRYLSDVTADAAKYGLVEDVTRVTVADETSETTLTLGAWHQEGIHAARREDTASVIGIESRFVESVPTHSLDWRPQRILPVPPFQVSLLRLENPLTESVLEMQKMTDGIWKVIKPEHKTDTVLDSERVSQYLSIIYDYRILDYLPNSSILPDTGLDPSALRLTTGSRYQSATLVLSTISDDSKNLRATFQGSEEIFLLDKRLSDLLSVSTEEIIARLRASDASE
ncbi:MAG TPA: DUF4340 domain-containing protein [bacterium]|nr:DUF4340 domain-containing protein [bacterium]